MERFPREFMFQMSKPEKEEVVTKCDHLSMLKFSPNLPYAFTEHGALMLVNVLKSPRAVEVSLLVVKTFVQLREMLATNKELAAKIRELEKKLIGHDQTILSLLEAVKQLMIQPMSGTRSNGFTADLADSKDR